MVDRANRDQFDDAFAENFRVARIAGGLSQQEVADQMTARGYEFHQSTVGKIERGKRRVSVGEAVALAQIVHRLLTELATSDSATQAELRAQVEFVGSLVAGRIWAIREAIADLQALRTDLLALAISYDSGADENSAPFGDDDVRSAAEFFQPLLALAIYADWEDIREFVDRYGLEARGGASNNMEE